MISHPDFWSITVCKQSMKHQLSPAVVLHVEKQTQCNSVKIKRHSTDCREGSFGLIKCHFLRTEMMAKCDNINWITLLHDTSIQWYLGQSWWLADECCEKAISWYHPATDGKYEADWTFFLKWQILEKGRALIEQPAKLKAANIRANPLYIWRVSFLYSS